MLEKWGEGKQGEELLQVLSPKVEEVIAGLHSFGEYSGADLKAALKTALDSHDVKICRA